MVGNAAALSALVVLGIGAAARLERHLELGVVERLDAFLLSAAGAVAIAVGLSALGRFGVAFPISVACAALAVSACACAELGDPVRLWTGVRRRGGARRGCRRARVALRVLGRRSAEARAGARRRAGVRRGVRGRGPSAARQAGARGHGARRPRRRAARGAASCSRGRDADLAVSSALRGALQTAVAPPLAATRPGAPELWTLDPVVVSRVDTAGYLQQVPGELPPELIVIACGEPEGTLRAESLAAVEVRRPDLRALSRWMDRREDGLRHARVARRRRRGRALPAFVPGRADLTLEEARALRELADALAPICHARAQLARSLAREQALRVEAEEATTRAERLEHTLARASAHHALASARLARPAAVGIYATRSRLAFEVLEKQTKAHAPIAIVAPSGTDPVPFLARAHLAGARGWAPLVLVDATSTREHDLERWRDPVASPLALADGGMLVLLDAAALPVDVQRLVGQSLAERRAPWPRGDALDIVLTVTTARDPAELLEVGKLDPLLGSRLGAALEDPVRLPRIAERPEDIRALVTDRLAREGMRVRSAPVGIDDAAFSVLVDHPFEGEDAELASIVQRLVARLPPDRDVIREADVRALLGVPADEGGVPKRARA